VLAAAATAMAEILGAVIARQLKYEFLDTLFSMIVGQNPLDTQDPSSYTLIVKKEVLIDSSAVPLCSCLEKAHAAKFPDEISELLGIYPDLSRSMKDIDEIETPGVPLCRLRRIQGLSEGASAGRGLKTPMATGGSAGKKRDV
ncbi:MAG: hypothetical protein KKD24_02305, partial [Proteobacteria bacterium]|nr:hypothetical protein [Pseudomonadota bacterium]